MFIRRLRVQYGNAAEIEAGQPGVKCPVSWIDNFSMRNFTNDAIFDDTLPIADGLLEAGSRVPLDRLQSAMTDWFRRKSYLKADEMVVVQEEKRTMHAANCI